jgi:nucleoid-associated protein EbfC
MMKGGLADMLKQAQQMQANLQKAQEEIKRIEVEGQSGGGMVKLIVNGSYAARRVTIDPSLLGAGTDKEMLEDLIAAAINDALHKIEAQNKEKMSAMMGGISLPEGLKLPF